MIHFAIKADVDGVDTFFRITPCEYSGQNVVIAGGKTDYMKVASQKEFNCGAQDTYDMWTIAIDDDLTVTVHLNGEYAFNAANMYRDISMRITSISFLNIDTLSKQYRFLPG